MRHSNLGRGQNHTFEFQKEIRQKPPGLKGSRGTSHYLTVNLTLKSQKNAHLYRSRTGSRIKGGYVCIMAYLGSNPQSIRTNRHLVRTNRPQRVSSNLQWIQQIYRQWIPNPFSSWE